MDNEVKNITNRRHIGRNIQKIRVYLGMKQEALAADLGVSQNVISKIEKESEIEEGLLNKIASVLGISAEVIKDFDVERAIYNINSYKDATISPGAIAAVYVASQQIRNRHLHTNSLLVKNKFQLRSYMKLFEETTVFP